MNTLKCPAPLPRTLLIAATAMSLAVGGASAAPSPSPRSAPAPAPRSAPAPAPRPAPAPAPKPAPAPAPRPAPAPPPAAKAATSFGAFGGQAKPAAAAPAPAPKPTSVGSFGGAKVTSAPGSVVRPTGGLSADLSSTAAKKQAFDAYEARKSGTAVPPTAAPRGPVLSQPPIATAGERNRATGASTIGAAAAGSRIGANDTYYQQQLDDQRRRARMAEDDRDYAVGQARRAQIRAAEAEMAAAQARRRVVAGAAVGGAAGYAGASALEESPAPESIEPAPISLPIPAPAEPAYTAAADASESWGEKLVMALILVPAFGFLFWAIYSRYIAAGSTPTTRRYTL